MLPFNVWIINTERLHFNTRQKGDILINGRKQRLPFGTSVRISTT